MASGLLYCPVALLQVPVVVAAAVAAAVVVAAAVAAGL